MKPSQLPQVPPRFPSLLVAIALLAPAVACGSEEPDPGSDGGALCTAELRTAVSGTVTRASGGGLLPSSVRASLDGGPVQDCDIQALESEDEPVRFQCWEQGGGVYEVTVEVAGQTQTRSAEVEADECHVTETAQLDFVFEVEECSHAGECEVYADACCYCGPLRLEDAAARPRDAEGTDPNCEGIACGGCIEAPPEPLTVVPACIEGVCEAVAIREQPYAQCEQDTDCTVVPASCCGFCEEANVGNAFAVRKKGVSDFQHICDYEVACPDIACPETKYRVEAYCHEDGYCDVREL